MWILPITCHMNLCSKLGWLDGGLERVGGRIQGKAGHA